MKVIQTKIDGTANILYATCKMKILTLLSLTPELKKYGIVHSNFGDYEIIIWYSKRELKIESNRNQTATMMGGFKTPFYGTCVITGNYIDKYSGKFHKLPKDMINAVLNTPEPRTISDFSVWNRLNHM